MAVYDDLTPEQKELLDTWINLIRSWTGEQSRANNHAVSITTMFVGQIQGILALFDTNVTIPNTSNLDGSQALNVGSEVVIIENQIQSVIDTYNTESVRNLWVKACGAPNMTG